MCCAGPAFDKLKSGFVKNDMASKVVLCARHAKKSGSDIPAY
jgi:hypothetical protein